MGQSRPLFVYFSSFLVTISIQIQKRVDGVLGMQTLGRRMVGADETTELWRPQNRNLLTGPNTDGQLYRHFMIVIYDSRVILTRKLRTI